MINIGRLARGTSLLVLGVAAIGAFGPAPSAWAADVHFIGGQDANPDNSWSNAANWSPAVVPGAADDVTIDAETDPDAGTNGAILNANEIEKAKSLDINASFSLLDDAKLTVSNGITNNGAGYFTNNGTVTAGTVTNTFTDDDHSGYIVNLRKFNADLDNSGVVYNGGEGSEDNHVVWIGNVSNSAKGNVTNTNNAVWQGSVTDNAGTIENTQGSTWKQGTIVQNEGVIDNDQGSVWQGEVESNANQINNIGGSRWQGNVDANSGSLNNNGGTWTGDVLSNDGAIYNTAGSIWNGDLTSGATGLMKLSGTVNGSITNNGGTVRVYDPLAGVTDFINTDGGTLDMDDGVAGSTFGAQSWSGTGTGEAAFDVALALGQSDHVVLSGDYSADTHIELYNVGPAGRTLGDIPLILVGGANTGTVEVDGLPGDGVISYQLAKTDAGWVIASSLNDAPSHVAGAIGLVGDAVASATQVPLARADACGRGGWIKGLGATHAESLSGLDGNLGFGGVEMGYDFACLDVGSTGARLGGGVLLGGVQGNIATRSPGDGSLNASFGGAFAGVYGALAAGALHAVVQGQVGLADYRLADPGALVPSATLTSTRLDLSGSASYELALGGVTLAPELGFAASQSYSTSDDFADVGKMALLNAPNVDVYAGATLSGAIGLGDGVTRLAPFASVFLHDALVSGGGAFSDGVGNSTAIAVAERGSYVALGVGADLLAMPVASGMTIDAGLRADLDYGETVSDTGLSGHIRLQF